MRGTRTSHCGIIVLYRPQSLITFLLVVRRRISSYLDVLAVGKGPVFVYHKGTVMLLAGSNKLKRNQDRA
jgi:hypothetical protein